MKLFFTPFTVIQNFISDIGRMHDFLYEIPAETHDEFWQRECAKYPTAQTCKTYDS
ncbi:MULTISPECIES: hypothetical protein [Prochlorococcus]|uniref:hypothetical protein n=1 Tax=Prochlorococcus TaxID=1218 RepID=UPI0005339E06|nr:MULTISPECIES: hypothetical protein [Prochlorococcus]KGG12788.1 protein family PM-14 [Prochlorococcus sp. MIT 0601]